MNSDPGRPGSAGDDGYEPEPDDEDTGPVRASTPPPDSDWDPAGSQGSWAGRFDAPLTVTPRPVRRQRNPKVLLGVAAAVVAVAVVGSVVFWLSRPSPDRPDAPAAAPPPTTTASPTSAPTSAEPAPRTNDESRLLRMLPRGYPPGSCEVVDAPEGALAQANCGRNIDPGGPLSAVYTLVRDKAALDAAFNNSVQTANRVNCPGNIQSPGPWRRNATPDRVSGMLFCGLREGQPMVLWTDDARLLVSAVESGPEGPTFPQLYAWWSSHS